MFTAEVYRTMVRSAGSNQEEYTALKVLEDWNTNQVEANGKVFIPVNTADGPKVDVVIGIVGSFLFDAEFFKKSVEAGKKVLLFFNAFHDASNSIKSEVEEVEAFKKQMETQCTCFCFNGSTEFAKILLDSLKVI